MQPCSVLNQLKRYVESDILPEGAVFQTARIPLKGSNEKYVHGDSPVGWSDVVVNHSAADRLIYYRESGLWPQVEQEMTEDVRRRAAKFVPDLKKDLSEGAGDEPFALEKIAANQLGKFLEDPVRQSIRRHLLLYDEDADVEEMTAAEDEPFYGRFPASYRLAMDPLRFWVDSIVAGRPEKQWDGLLVDLCRKYYQRSRMESLVPEGAYGDLDCEEVLEEVVSRGEMLKPLLKSMVDGGNQLLHAVCSGETQDSVFVRPEKIRIFKAPPWHAEIDSPASDGEPAARPVQLHGWLPCLWKDSGGTWNSLILTGRGRPSKKNRKPVIDKYILAPVLSRMLTLGREDVETPLAAAPVVFHVAYKTAVQSWKCELDPDKADEYVRALVKDYLDPNLRAWLPLGSVIDAVDDVDRCFSADISREEEARFRADLREALNESEDPLIHLAKPEVPDDALRIACRRFGIFFETISATDTPE